MVILISQAVLLFGLHSLMFALQAIAIAQLHLSVDQVATLYAVTLLPFIFFPIPAGRILDRRNPAKIILATSCALFIATILFMYLLILDITSQPMLTALSFAAATAMLVVRLGYFPIIRDTFPAEEANKLKSTLIGNEQLAQVCAPIFMTIVISTDSINIGLTGSAVLLPFAALLCLMATGRGFQPAIYRTTYVAPATDLCQDIRHIFHCKPMRFLLKFLITFDLFYGMYISSYFYYAVAERGLSLAEVSSIAAISSLGNFAAKYLVQHPPFKHHMIGDLSGTLLLSAISSSVLLLLLLRGSHDQTWLTFSIALFLSTAAANISTVFSVNLRQQLFPRHLTSALGLSTSITYIALVLGSALNGIIGKYLAVNNIVLISITGMIAASIVALIIEITRPHRSPQ